MNVEVRQSGLKLVHKTTSDRSPNLSLSGSSDSGARTNRLGIPNRWLGIRLWGLNGWLTDRNEWTYGSKQMWVQTDRRRGQNEGLKRPNGCLRGPNGWTQDSDKGDWIWFEKPLNFGYSLTNKRKRCYRKSSGFMLIKLSRFRGRTDDIESDCINVKVKTDNLRVQTRDLRVRTHGLRVRTDELCDWNG